MLKRTLLPFLLVVMLTAASLPAAAMESLAQRIGRLESFLHGRATDGPLLNRIGQLERDLLGRQAETMVLYERLDALERALSGAGGEGYPLAYAVGLLEWLMGGRLSNDPLTKRIDQLETALLGGVSTGTIGARVGQLVQATFSTSQVPNKKVSIADGTPVRIRFLAQASSATTLTGAQIPFELASNLAIDGTLLAPAGTRGTATVTEARASDQVGKAGVLKLDFGTLRLMDGTTARLGVVANLPQQNREAGLSTGEELATQILTLPGQQPSVFLSRKEVEVRSGAEMIVAIVQGTATIGYPLR